MTQHMQAPYPTSMPRAGMTGAFAPATRKPASFKFGAMLSMFFIIEGFIVKSFYFTGNDPVLLHYVASAATCALAVLILFFSVGLRHFSMIEGLLLGCGFAWSFASSLASGQQSNILASTTFTLSVLMSFVCVPRLMYAANYDTIKFLRASLGVIVVLSAVILLLFSNYAYDPGSGRFSGAAISVAVACNLFFFATIFYGYSTKEKHEWRARSVSLVILAMSVAFLFLTFTRTLLVEAAAMLLLLVFTNRQGKIQGKTLVIAAGIFLVLSFLALLYLVMKDINIEQLMFDFRLGNGGSTTDSRMGNWLFAIDRIRDAPWFGEGMLTKQTAGGGELDLDVSGGTYNVIYDPHSLPLSFGVQAGIPFALLMMSFLVWVNLRHLLVFGITKSLASVDFMIGLVLFIGMIPGGGDLTSMGNAIDRIYWITLGISALRTNLEVARQNQARKSSAIPEYDRNRAMAGYQQRGRSW